MANQNMKKQKQLFFRRRHSISPPHDMQFLFSENKHCFLWKTQSWRGPGGTATQRRDGVLHPDLDHARGVLLFADPSSAEASEEAPGAVEGAQRG